MKRTKTDLVKAWLVKAQKDLLFAQEALKKGEEYTDMACFHAQQSAEKTVILSSHCPPWKRRSKPSKQPTGYWIL